MLILIKQGVERKDREGGKGGGRERGEGGERGKIVCFKQLKHRRLFPSLEKKMFNQVKEAKFSG